MNWIQKTTQWFYITIWIGEDFEAYEILEPNENSWTEKNVFKWIVDNYISIIKHKSDIAFKIDLIEYELPDASEE